MRSLRLFLRVSLIVFAAILSGCGEKTAPPALQETAKPAPANQFADVLKKAEAGDVDAQLRLGSMYHEGKGVSKDAVMAANWYQKAAAQGNAEAQKRLGTMYLAGVGVPKDPAVGIGWLQKAATQGEAVAQNWLGLIYREGHGVPKDDAKAAEWLQKAATQGLATAQSELAEMYFTGTGVPKDAAKAVAWLQKSAAQGDAVAQQNLARMYVKGEGVPQDAAKAAEWLQKAAAQGLAVSQNNLGAMYGKGEGVPQDAAKALEWYQKAAAQGHAAAQCNLAGMYFRGEGVPKDLVLAYAWLSLAAKQGDADSVRDLRRAEGLVSKGELQEAQRLSANWKKGQLLAREGGSSTAQPVSNGGKFDTIAEWVKIGSIPKADVYVDSSTIRKNGNMVTMWTLFDNTDPLAKSYGAIGSLKEQSEYDCSQKRSRGIAMVFYLGRMGDGDVVRSTDETDQWIPSAPGSIGETQWKVACGKTKLK